MEKWAAAVDKFGNKMDRLGDKIDQAMESLPRKVNASTIAGARDTDTTTLTMAPWATSSAAMLTGGAIDVYRAASTGQAHTISDLIARNDTVSLEYLDPQDRTPLLIACTNGHLDCAQILLERGANAAAVDMDGNTALHVACLHGRVDVVQMLLLPSTYVVSPYILNKKGQSALRLSRAIVQAKGDGWLQVTKCIQALEQRLKVFEGWMYHRSQSMFAWQSWEARYGLVLRTGSPMFLEMHLFDVQNGHRTPIPTLVFDIQVDKPVTLYRDGDGLNRKPLAIGLESQVLAAFNESGFEAWGAFFTTYMSSAVYEGTRPPASAVPHHRTPPPSTKDISQPLDQLHRMSGSSPLVQASAPAWDNISSISVPPRDVAHAIAVTSAPPPSPLKQRSSKSVELDELSSLATDAVHAAPALPSAPPSAAPLVDHGDDMLMSHTGEDGKGGEFARRNEECVVCMDRAKQTVCVPCGHVAACVACAEIIQRTSQKCPICRTPVKELVKLWLA